MKPLYFALSLLLVSSLTQARTLSADSPQPQGTRRILSDSTSTSGGNAQLAARYKLLQERLAKFEQTCAQGKHAEQCKKLKELFGPRFEALKTKISQLKQSRASSSSQSVMSSAAATSSDSTPGASAPTLGGVQ